MNQIETQDILSETGLKDEGRYAVHKYIRIYLYSAGAMSSMAYAIAELRIPEY
jgi:hypothetical protein